MLFQLMIKNLEKITKKYKTLCESDNNTSLFRANEAYANNQIELGNNIIDSIAEISLNNQLDNHHEHMDLLQQTNMLKSKFNQIKLKKIWNSNEDGTHYSSDDSDGTLEKQQDFIEEMFAQPSFVTQFPWNPTQ